MRKRLLLSAGFYFLLFCTCSTARRVSLPEQQIHYEAVNTLTGKYTDCILAMRPGKKMKPYGMFKIELNDTLSVILLPPYKKEAIRPKSEVRKFNGKMVTVTGYVTDRTYFSKPSVMHVPQWVKIPCFLTIEEIKLLETR